MDSFPLSISLFLIISTAFLFLRSTFRHGRAKPLPPGPKPLPIVGNFLQLGIKKPYESLAKLAKTHGPLMSLHLGSLCTIIVSSPEMAREILQHHGQVFSGRTVTQAMHARGLNKLSMAFTPTGKEWRDKRKICKEQVSRLARGFAARSCRWSSCCGKVVDVHEAVLVTNLNLMLTTLFSTRSREFKSEVTREFQEIVEAIASEVVVANVADYFPILRSIDPQGIKRKAELYFGKLFGKFEFFLNERLESRRASPSAPREKDLLETLVDITQGNDYNLTNDDIPYLLFDFWNIRGLHKPHKQHMIRRFCNLNNVDMIGILETKFKESVFLSFFNKFFSDWNFSNNFDLVRTGRILLLWNPVDKLGFFMHFGVELSTFRVVLELYECVLV